jgi:hypothetical protein
MRSQTNAWKLAASKVEVHQGHMPKRQPPFQGKIRIAPNSGLRKRMRAIRRGKEEAWWPETKKAEEAMLRRYKLLPTSAMQSGEVKGE